MSSSASSATSRDIEVNEVGGLEGPVAGEHDRRVLDRDEAVARGAIARLGEPAVAVDAAGRIVELREVCEARVVDVVERIEADVEGDLVATIEQHGADQEREAEAVAGAAREHVGQGERRGVVAEATGGEDPLDAEGGIEGVVGEAFGDECASGVRAGCGVGDAANDGELQERGRGSRRGPGGCGEAGFAVEECCGGFATEGFVKEPCSAQGSACEVCAGRVATA